MALTEPELFVIGLALAVVSIILIYYFTTDRQSKDTGSADPDSQVIAAVRDITIHDVNRKTTIYHARVVHKGQSDVNGDFEGMFVGSNGKVRLNTANVINTMNEDSIFQGDETWYYYANGPQEAYLRENIRIKKDNARLYGLVTSLDTVIKEYDIRLEDRIQMELEKVGSRTRAKSVQGYKQFDQQQQGMMRMPGRYVRRRVAPRVPLSEEGTENKPDEAGGDWA